MSVTINDSLAKIAISKNLIKEYKTSDSNRTVYLNNGTEFQIYLKNPYPYHIGIKIYVNDKYIGNTLVLRPGQSTWLDRYLDNESRFLFSTYEVDDTPEMSYATSKNGKVKIEFYKERDVQTSTISSSPWLGNLSVCTNGVVKDYTYNDCYNTSTKLTSCCNSTLNSSYCDTNTFSFNSGVAKGIEIDRSATNAVNKTKLETGRIEKGSHSDQKFENCDVQFEYSSFKTEDFLILPNSRKQVRVEQTRRKYCSQCGSKVSPKDKFCSNCGAKL